MDKKKEISRFIDKINGIEKTLEEETQFEKLMQKY